MSIQASILNVVLLVKNGTPQLAAKLLNVNDKADATLMVADCVDLLEKHEFAALHNALREETKNKEPIDLVLISNDDALELVQYAHRRG